jgi:hypothetical protein
MYDGITYFIPCSARKGTRPAAARDLYTGPMFRHTLACAEANAALDRAAGNPARILILSARHGLVGLDDELAPYDTKMGGPGSVTPALLAGQAWQHGIRNGSDVYALLPAAYYGLLDDALKRLDVYLQDVYEATAGIGEQRHVNAVIAIP